MATHTRNIGRADLLIHRGMTERFGARWQQDRLDGTGITPVDLTDWTVQWEMSLPDGRVIDTRACTTNDNGLAWVQIPADAYTSDIWKTRITGNWKISATNPTAGHVEIIGHGHWTLI